MGWTARPQYDFSMFVCLLFAQIYIMMAEDESIESHARITYLQKASHTLSDAIEKFGSSDLVSYIAAHTYILLTS